MRTQALDFDEAPDFDEAITDWKLLSLTPYGSPVYNNNDEIRIGAWQQNVITQPSGSYLIIEGKLTADDDKPAGENVKFINNAMAFLFEEIKYYIGGVQIDCTRNVGVTSTLKNLCSLDYPTSRSLGHTGWNPEYKETMAFGTKGAFRYCVPLKMLLGFAEDYQKIVTGVAQELVLLRGSDNRNVLLGKKSGNPAALPAISLSISKVVWRMPYITVSDNRRLQMLRFIEQDSPISIAFRSWDLYEFPSLQKSDKHLWSVRTASTLERPRYVIVAFQNNRKNNYEKDNSCFDHLHVDNIRLYLNSQYYPYESTQSNFEENSFSVLYEMYRNFRNSYYADDDRDGLPGFMTPNFYAANAPLFVIDCENQAEPIKPGACDVRLEIILKKAITDSHVSAFCLIIHDNILEYTPLTGMVKRVT